MCHTDAYANEDVQQTAFANSVLAEKTFFMLLQTILSVLGSTVHNLLGISATCVHIRLGISATYVRIRAHSAV